MLRCRSRAESPRPARRRAPIRRVLGDARLLASLAGCVLLSGCPSSDGKPAPSASTSGSAAPSATASASAAAKRKPYSGPTGALHGVVKITGDPAPAVSFHYPTGCESAAATYGKLFRVGQDGTLADALVAVTRYQGYVPPKRKVVKVTVRDCAFSTRTVALTDGQHIEVRNLDPLRGYVPHLKGARSPATMVAVPRGEAVKLHSRGPGRYWLDDQMDRPFLVADVFHLRYATTDVTGLDGAYRIEGIPVGEVQVSVLLPAANLLTLNKKTTIKAGDNSLDLTLTFKADRDTPHPDAGAPSAAPTAGSAKP